MDERVDTLLQGLLDMRGRTAIRSSKARVEERAGNEDTAAYLRDGGQDRPP
jgi:hypothetical protein